ncbi:MAG TPA: polyamine aminopropyltransferase [Burkholderiales bacterium]|nr:polyamine aminopropyltransferase [Burkholderiales bacterium]
MTEDKLLTEWLNANCGYFYRAGKQLEEFDTPYQHLEVYDTPEVGRLFRLDGCFMTSEKEEFFYHENLIHPAAIAHPAPRKALIIGGGDGGSSEELLKHAGIESVILVELDQAVVDISKKYFHAVHQNVFDDPRLKLHLADGMTFVRETRERFDLIALDLPDPIGPATELYTAEFFASCRRVLNPGGALSLHVGSPISRPDRVRDNVVNLKKVFRIVRPYLVYIPLYGSLWGMACVSDSLDPLTLAPEEVERVLKDRHIADLRYYNGYTHQAVFALPNFVRRIT